MSELETTREVIVALGGYKAVAELTKTKVSAVYNWTTHGHFPARTYPRITAALEAQKYRAPLRLWRTIEP